MSQLHQILVGDCIEMIRTLPDKSVHTCVTSPPYFGLRDYGVDGQIGLETSPREFIDRLVLVFCEVHRARHDDGTNWVNMGDSYAANGIPGQSNLAALGERYRGGGAKRDTLKKPRKHLTGNLKQKDLMGIPWRLAVTLQDDGWYLRQDIIWHKPNPMPESIQDRCTKAHEYLFLLGKSPKYYFDWKAMQEPAKTRPRGDSHSFARNTATTPPPGTPRQHRDGRRNIAHRGTRNKSSVWSVATHPYKGAHFATFPPDLIRPCILAGAPRGGVVLDPFGAGTTALVAMQEGRRSVLCELNSEYAGLARSRLHTAWLDGASQMDLMHDSVPAGAAPLSS